MVAGLIGCNTKTASPMRAITLTWHIFLFSCFCLAKYLNRFTLAELFVWTTANWCLVAFKCNRIFEQIEWHKQIAQSSWCNCCAKNQSRITNYFREQNGEIEENNEKTIWFGFVMTNCYFNWFFRKDVNYVWDVLYCVKVWKFYSIIIIFVHIIF